MKHTPTVIRVQGPALHMFLQQEGVHVPLLSCCLCRRLRPATTAEDRVGSVGSCIFWQLLRHVLSRSLPACFIGRRFRVGISKKQIPTLNQ